MDYADVLALNALLDTDLVFTSQRRMCVNIVAFGPASVDGSLLHGRNLDFPSREALHCAATVFLCRPSKGHAYLSVSWAGFSGVLTAMNAAGVTVAGISFISREVRAEGAPAPFIMRKIAQYASCVDDAVEIVAASQRMAGFNLVVTDWKVPEARAIEFTAKRYGVRRARRGCLVVSDNCLSRMMSKE